MRGWGKHWKHGIQMLFKSLPGFSFYSEKNFGRISTLYFAQARKKEKRKTLNPVQFNQFNINLGIIHSNFLNLVFFSKQRHRFDSISFSPSRKNQTKIICSSHAKEAKDLNQIAAGKVSQGQYIICVVWAISEYWFLCKEYDLNRNHTLPRHSAR